MTEDNCCHDWQSTGMLLMQWIAYDKGRELIPAAEVEVCAHCGILRIPPKAQT